MICSNCGLISLDEEDDNVEMYICKKCSVIFCSNCAENQGFNCNNEECKADLVIIDANLEYLLFDQSWRHIKKGGFS